MFKGCEYPFVEQISNTLKFLPGPQVESGVYQGWFESRIANYGDEGDSLSISKMPPEL